MSMRFGVPGLAVLALACAPLGQSLREEDEAVEAAQLEETCAEDDSCVTFVCGDGACALYRCEDGETGEVVFTRGTGGLAPPAAPGSPRRWWGPPDGFSRGREPVFVIPWKQYERRPLLPSQTPSGRMEKHHIFPQARDLAGWFRGKGINIHQYTMLIPHHVHSRIHSEGARGGLWNQAWRQFRDSNIGASQQEIYAHAGQLIFRFELLGPLLPYR
jgi:uncharacterized lipoprotein (TIGR02269 family)